ncbi:heavy metal translocating P-type ATPase [Paracoccus sp. CPCC 101403]|uniref:P-type Zn(2+) transporter n=1 Tax=Paracoccus broussonetiae TaxID=3075834 RepID=A0ABU3E9R4_9RHOB|nr:heavy metal translocating P-type ATPase [Paracoccus sp. CPCC 101403]MDT1060956.1 heavy metal translocating P-type ATPase [Paracoccus sp. CPCC 101403]
MAMAQVGERREWTVTGMDCAACSSKVVRAVERMPGVSEVKVALMSERLTLNLAPGTTQTDAIEAAVRKLGYGIAPKGQEAPRKRAFVIPEPLPEEVCCAGRTKGSADTATGAHDHDHDHDHPSAGAGHGHMHDDPLDRGKPWYRTGKGRLVLLTGALLVLAWAFEIATTARIGAWAFVIACLIGLAPVAKRAFQAARMGQPFTIESLMTIAAVGALFIGAAEEAALVVFLFAVGEVLEGVAANKARNGIRAMAQLVPKTAIVETGGQLREVAAESLQIGQTVLVRPGERIPADGEIVEGSSGIDESPVTGESVPRTKGPGEPVFAGSINAEAALRIRVSKEASDNTIARIVRLVEEAEEARAPTERFIDRFSRWYMPVVVGIAALVVLVPPLAFGADWDTWIYRGLALLLIGCPCALVISVPASIASALSSGARRGLLLKGGAVIEAAAKVTRVAFDKTGTLTVGKPVVTDLIPAPGIDEAELLSTAAAVEAGSSHPLAQAILRRAAEAGVTIPASQGARAIVGKGVEAMVDGAPAWVSSPRHAADSAGIEAEGTRHAAELEAQGKTVVAVFRDRRPLGLVAMRDEPRADAAEAMRQLKALDVGATMLTGDNPRTAAAISGHLGLEFRAEMMPEDKLTAIRDMGGQGSVMMIGDGINDAPALKQAGIGVAMGSGTDVALETADAAILRDRVTDVPALIRLSRRTMGNIRQNVALALGLKAVFLVTSILGITGLWIAIMADTGATVLVTLNALRLLGYDPAKAD